MHNTVEIMNAKTLAQLEPFGIDLVTNVNLLVHLENMPGSIFRQRQFFLGKMLVFSWYALSGHLWTLQWCEHNFSSSGNYSSLGNDL